MTVDQFTPLFEMRCPSCKETMQIKVRSLELMMSRCCHCKKPLAVQPEIEAKPNNILISLAVVAVEFPVKNPVGKKLERVA